MNTAATGAHVPPNANAKGGRRLLFFWGACLFVCAVSVPLACMFGPVPIPSLDAFKALAGMLGESGNHADGGALQTIVADIRLPRTLLAFATGAGLGIAGVVFQAILRNPLADPFTLGVSGGAAFGAALAISFGLTGAAFGFGLPLFAFAGAAAALFAVIALSNLGGGLKHETLILAGIVISAFLAALIALIKALDEASVTGIVFWIMGSFQGRGAAELAIAAPGLCLGGAAAFAMTKELDLLSLGGQSARNLGLNVPKTRLLLLLAAGAVTGSAVAVSGIIGFVGLIVPHLCRILLGGGHALLLPASALGGGLLLLWSDTAARTLLPGGVELPVGVITALLGGPFFCYLLAGRKRTSAPLLTQPAPDALLQRESAPSAPGTKTTPEANAEAAPEANAEAGAEATPDGKRDTRKTDPAPAVVCENLRYSYPASGSMGVTKNGDAKSGETSGRAALEEVSLSAGRGEFVGLLGPNGSGKSTFLQAVAGHIPVSGGTVLVAGENIRSLSARMRARRVSLLPQRPEALPALNVFSLVLMGRYAFVQSAFGGRFPLGGTYSQNDEIKAAQALAEVDALALARRFSGALSGGELQRILLARALVQETPVLLLDEATTGLDPRYQTHMLDLVKKRCARGLTVLAALHDINLASLYCDRIVFLKDGAVVASGTPGEVITPELLERVYAAPFIVTPHPVNGKPQALFKR